MPLSKEEVIKCKRAAYKAGVPLEAAISNYKHLKSNPYDHLQPGDPMFNKVWGKRNKEQQDKIDKKRKDAEEKRREYDEYINRVVNKEKGGRPNFI